MFPRLHFTVPVHLIPALGLSRTTGTTSWYRYCFLITYQAQPGPVGLARAAVFLGSQASVPRTVLVAPLSRACRGLEARAPRREARDSAKPRSGAVRIVRNQVLFWKLSRKLALPVPHKFPLDFTYL